MFIVATYMAVQPCLSSPPTAILTRPPAAATSRRYAAARRIRGACARAPAAPAGVVDGVRAYRRGPALRLRPGPASRTSHEAPRGHGAAKKRERGARSGERKGRGAEREGRGAGREGREARRRGEERGQRGGEWGERGEEHQTGASRLVAARYLWSEWIDLSIPGGASDSPEEHQTVPPRDTCGPRTATDATDAVVQGRARGPGCHARKVPYRALLSYTRCVAPETRCAAPETRCVAPETRCVAPETRRWTRGMRGRAVGAGQARGPRGARRRPE